MVITLHVDDSEDRVCDKVDSLDIRSGKICDVIGIFKTGNVGTYLMCLWSERNIN